MFRVNKKNKRNNFTISQCSVFLYLFVSFQFSSSDHLAVSVVNFFKFLVCWCEDIKTGYFLNIPILNLYPEGK